MMITAQPGTYLYEVCADVATLCEGNNITFSAYDLYSNIASFWHNDAKFTAPDRVMENIVGSAYTHSYHVSPNGQQVTFRRHYDDGRFQRSYSSPDRRNLPRPPYTSDFERSSK